MITLSVHADISNRVILKLYGLSKDDKPIKKFKNTTIKNASIYYEMDTKKCFVYDEENHVWHDM